MSGGSYEYLCWAGPDDLFAYGRHTEALNRMIDRLSGLGYADDAAREAAELQLIVRQAMTRVETIQRRLAGVFKAVEWWDSSDSGEDGVQEALAAYRGEGLPARNQTTDPDMPWIWCTWTVAGKRCGKSHQGPLNQAIGWSWTSAHDWRCPDHNPRPQTIAHCAEPGCTAVWAQRPDDPVVPNGWVWAHYKPNQPDGWYCPDHAGKP